MDVVRLIAAVTVVLALLGAAVWALRRGPAASRSIRAAGWLAAAAGARFKGPAAIERVDRLVLTPQHTLHLVRVQGLEMVVATHPQGCSVIQTGPGTFRSGDGGGA